MSTSGTVKIGALLSTQRTDWTGLRDAALAAERAGWDSLWTSDHLLCPLGPPEAPLLEGWTTITALGALTRDPSIGLLVSSNTLRHPALVAKMAVALDHVSGGRAVLGMGAGWFEAEHRVHGIGAGSSPGERIDRLRASVSIIRGLVDGERVDHQSRWYTLQGARHAPRPVQRRLPILVGGEGRKMTLRLVAEQADMWSAQGSYDRLDRAVRDLQEHCRAVGRDPQTIEQLASRWIIIRDRATTAAEHRTVTERQHGMAEVDAATVVLGPPELIAESLRPIVALGFRHIVVNLRSPWDYETIARMPDVRDLLADRVG